MTLPLLLVATSFRSCCLCDRPVEIGWWRTVLGGPVFCEDSDFCTLILTSTLTEPPEPEPDHPNTIPPEDIDVCTTCLGSGEVFVRQDWQTGAYVTEECRTCRGSGEYPG